VAAARAALGAAGRRSGFRAAAGVTNEKGCFAYRVGAVATFFQALSWSFQGKK
jgi:hypothetical protein